MDGAARQATASKALFSSQFSFKFHYKKEDFPSHQNIGKMHEVLNVDEIKN
jgi:hypothetical protein